VRIYLDHAATAPVRPEARAAWDAFFDGPAGNPSSVHAEGRRARAALDEARAAVAALVGASDPDEVVFTSGGTEADALAILGAARAWEDAHGRPGAAVTTAVEHPAVAGAFDLIEARSWRVARVAPARDGAAPVDAIAAAIDAAGADLAVVSVMAVNNESGALHDVAAVGRLVAERRGRRGDGPWPVFHVDAVQAAGRVPIDAEAWNADIVAVSGHKIGGPAGAGALLVRRSAPVAPIFSGRPGRQERGRRGGTPPVAAIVGMDAAARAARADLSREGPRLRALAVRLRDRLVGLGAVENSDAARGLPGLVNVSFVGLDGADLVAAMDLEGVAASHGAACASGVPGPSRVLAAMGLDPRRVRGAVRFSAGPATTEAEIDRAIEVVALCLGRTRAAAA
jgi:cysteine desulfurase